MQKKIITKNIKHTDNKTDKLYRMIRFVQSFIFSQELCNIILIVSNKETKQLNHRNTKNALTIITKKLIFNRVGIFEMCVAAILSFSNIITTAQNSKPTINLIKECWTSKYIHSPTSLFKEKKVTLNLIKNESDTTEVKKSIWEFSENFLTVSKIVNKEKKIVFKCPYSYDDAKKLLKLNFDYYFIEYTFQPISPKLEMAILKKIENRHEHFPKKEEKPLKLPKKKNVWVFILCGQSNMAGRAKVAPEDTVAHERIFTINQNGDVILAKEPIHFYEPKFNGLGCGLSFAHELLEHVPKNTSILIIPAAIGGSSIKEWINDSIVSDVRLLTNFSEKVALGMSYGIIKSILWHQGENDTRTNDLIKIYDAQLRTLFSQFRKIVENPEIPILIGGLGTYSEKEALWKNLNEKIHDYIKTDTHAFFVSADGLVDIGDRIHFNSASIRELGKRFAKTYLQILEK